MVNKVRNICLCICPCDKDLAPVQSSLPLPHAPDVLQDSLVLQHALGQAAEEGESDQGKKVTRSERNGEKSFCYNTNWQLTFGICKVLYALDSIYKWYCISRKVVAVVAVAPVTTTTVVLSLMLFLFPLIIFLHPSLLLWQLPPLLVVAELLEHVLRVPQAENQVGDGDVSVGHLDSKKSQFDILNNKNKQIALFLCTSSPLTKSPPEAAMIFSQLLKNSGIFSPKTSSATDSGSPPPPRCTRTSVSDYGMIKSILSWGPREGMYLFLASSHEHPVQVHNHVRPRLRGQGAPGQASLLGSEPKTGFRS